MIYFNISCMMDETSVQQTSLPKEIFHLLGPLQTLRHGTCRSDHRDWAINSQFLHANTSHTVEKLEQILLHICFNQMVLFRRCSQKAAFCQLWNSQVDSFLLKYKIIIANFLQVSHHQFFHPEFLLYCWCCFFCSMWRKTDSVKRKGKKINDKKTPMSCRLSPPGWYHVANKPDRHLPVVSEERGTRSFPRAPAQPQHRCLRGLVQESRWHPEPLAISKGPQLIEALVSMNLNVFCRPTNFISGEKLGSF